MKRFYILMTLIFLIFSNISYAYNEVYSASTESESFIESNIILIDDSVNIYGEISNATESNYVSLLLKQGNKIVFADQTISNVDGTFSFDFEMPEELDSGTYSYQIGSSSDAECYIRSFQYNKPANTVMTASAVPTGKRLKISGQVYNAAESYYISLLLKKGSKIVFVDQTTSSSSDGTFSFSFKMPTSCTDGTYSYFIRSSSAEKRYVGKFEYYKPTGKIMTVNSQVNEELVKITGAISGVTTPEQVTLEVRQNKNIILTDQVNSEQNGQFTFEFKLPNECESGTYDYYIESDYATDIYRGSFICEIPNKVSKILYVSRGQITPCFIQLNNIENINDKKVTIQFEGEYVELYDACFFTSKREISAGEIENLGIVIESISNNQIVMSFKENYVANKTNIDTVMNGISFVGKTDTNTRVMCTITDK